MEDRDSRRLWLAFEHAETSDLSGIDVVHRFINQVPDRTDLPRTIDDFTDLTICEVDDDFEPPSGLLFERTSRPGQGVLTGNPTLGISLVLIAPQHPGQARALRDWGDFVHIRHIAEAAVPGMTMITPYRNVSSDDPMFMHLYEIDRPDAEAVFQTMTPLVTERIGAPDTDAWKRWAMCPELKICYVNSFTKVLE